MGEGENRAFSSASQEQLTEVVKVNVRRGGALGVIVVVKEEEVRGERTEETNASTLVRVTSRVTISPKIHCEQTQM